MRNPGVEKVRKEDAAEFCDWFNAAWIESGGLIQPKIAAKLLGVSYPRIPQIIKYENLTVYRTPQLGSRYLLSLSEITAVINKRKKKRIECATCKHNLQRHPLPRS